MVLDRADAIKIARDNGCRIPAAAFDAAVSAEIPYGALLAVLDQETGGGDNVFGHDRRNGEPIFHGREDRAEVTEEVYAAYAVYRDIGPEPRCQGVGPMQLTSRGVQQQADAAGGCWDPRANVLTGARFLASIRDDGRTWWETFLAYNGSPAYADQVQARFDRWRELLKPARIA